MQTCAIEETVLIGVIDRLQGHRGGGLIEIIGSTTVGIVPVLDKRENRFHSFQAHGD